MNIIIIGCGKVGCTLAEALAGENHNIVAVDTRPEKIKRITDTLDIMGIVGNGASHTVLTNAGVASADLLIAVTGSDEENLLCCVIAKKSGHCHTIARIRNPIYNEEMEFLRKEFGLSMIINPELIAANEIAKIFQFPSAIRVDTFARGRVELLHFKIGAESPLCGVKLSRFRAALHCGGVLVCTITRDGGEVLIPNGESEFLPNDTVSIVATRRDAIDFFRKIGLAKNRVSDAIIAGGGKISYYLAKSLLMSGIQTKIIEIDPARCRFLSEQLPNATVLCGDATDQTLLSEECIESARGFAALTGLDEENILLSLYVGGISSAKTVTKINRINFTSVINRLDLGSIIYPRALTAEYIIKYVRSMNNSPGSNVEALYKLEDGRAEVLEFLLKENSSVCNIPLQELKLRRNTLICCIYRNHQVIVPSGADCMTAGDFVMVATSGYHVSDIREILED